MNVKDITGLFYCIDEFCRVYEKWEANKLIPKVGSRNRGLQLITGIKRNMKNHLMPLIDKVRLKGRFIVESVFNILKNNMNLEHTRHRSHLSFCINLLAYLAFYSFRKYKPSWKSISIISYP